MKAIIWSKYGPPGLLRYGELEKPTPKENEVLIKIHAGTVTAGDCEIRRFEIHPLFWLPLRLYLGWFKPKMPSLGQEFSGTVVEVGTKVKEYKVGDPLFGSTGIRFGAYVEFRTQRSSFPMAIKPTGISFKEAATITTGGTNGLHFVRKARLSSGNKLLIIGAGGSIGTYALQLAKLDGAEVTCVDSSIKLDMLTKAGADHVIDFEKEELDSFGPYDAIIDVVGKNSFRQLIDLMNPNGRLVLGNPQMRLMIRGMIWRSLFGFFMGPRQGKEVYYSLAGESAKDLNYLGGLVQDGAIRSIIDKVYPLERVPEAHQYVDEGLKKGNVVISIVPDDESNEQHK